MALAAENKHAPLPEPFAGNFRRARRVMMEIEPANLTWMFRVTAGLDSLANTNGIERLGGWEAPGIELRGHTCGHWLSGMANVVRETDDPEAKRRGAEVVHALAECQSAIGTGYVSAFPEEFIDRAIARKKVWAPWYTLHKILAGLLDQYEKAGNAEALEVARGFGDVGKIKPYTETFEKRDYPTERVKDFHASKLAFVNEDGIVIKPLHEINGERWVVYWN